MADSIDHGQLITWVNESDDATTDARESSEKARDYYDSKQWTAAEVATLKARNQAATVINRIKPKVDALLGMEKSAKTTVKAFPRTPKHEQEADAATEAIRFVLNDNLFEQVRSLVWEFMLIEGTGGCDIVVEPQGDDFKVKINSIFWDRIIFDPHSRRRDFTDARYLGQVVWVDKDEAIALYPGKESMLEDMMTGSTTYDDKPQWMDTTRDRVKLVEMYYHEDKEWHFTVFTRGGYLKDPIVSPYKNEEGETEHGYEFMSAFVDREGARYGAVKQLLDVQDEINKRRSKALHLMSVRQVVLDRGAVEDINLVRQELAKPDGVVEKTPEMEFEILKTGDMAAAQFDLLTEAKNEIDAVGVNAALTGKDQRVISGIALQERKLAGQTELGPLFDALRHWQLRVFRKVWNRVRQYWRAEKWVRVTDDEQNLKWVGLNKKVTKGQQLLAQAQQQGAPPEALQQLQAQLAADPMMQEVVQTQGQLAELDVDLILQEIPDTVSTQVEEFQALAEMVKSGIPIPPMAIIEASQLPHKEKILKAMKEAGPQLPPQVQEQMQKVQEDMQKLQQENQQLKLDKQEGMAKIQAEHDAKMKQLELQAVYDTRELALKKQKQDAEIALANEKCTKELDIKNRAAAADAHISKRSADHEATLNERKLTMEQQTRERDEAHKVSTEAAPKIQEMAKGLQQELKQGLAEIQQLVEEVDDSPVVRAEAVRDASGKMVRVLLTREDGTTQEVSTVLH